MGAMLAPPGCWQREAAGCHWQGQHASHCCLSSSAGSSPISWSRPASQGACSVLVSFCRRLRATLAVLVLQLSAMSNSSISRFHPVLGSRYLMFSRPPVQIVFGNHAIVLGQLGGLQHKPACESLRSDWFPFT